jgi:hypothetical protein
MKLLKHISSLYKTKKEEKNEMLMKKKTSFEFLLLLSTCLLLPLCFVVLKFHFQVFAFAALRIHTYAIIKASFTYSVTSSNNHLG